MDATVFAVLGEPTRLRIVELLRQRPLDVGDLVARLGVRQPQVSKHLKVLREAGIVTVEPVSRRRIYRLRAEPFVQLGEWVGSFEHEWEARLDSLDVLLSEIDDAGHDDVAGDDQ